MKIRLILLLPLAMAAIAAVSRAEEAPNNVVEALEAKLEKGEVKFSYTQDGHGYLKSMLEALKVSPEDEGLKFALARTERSLREWTGQKETAEKTAGE